MGSLEAGFGLTDISLSKELNSSLVKSWIMGFDLAPRMGLKAPSNESPYMWDTCMAAYVTSITSGPSSSMALLYTNKEAIVLREVMSKN